MATGRAVFFLLVAAHAIVVTQAQMGAATQAQTNPLKKVITLEEMKKQVTKEADEDAKSYEKFECWCTSGRN
jgi:hypothetical protein